MSTETKQNWLIMVSCFICMFMIQGGLQTFAVFLPAIMEETGFSLTAVAMISTVATLAAFIANMTIGALLKKMSAKAILFMGALICASHFIVYSYSYTLVGLYIGAFLGGLSIGWGTVAPISVVMTNWFIKKRASYMAIVVAGSMIGGAVLMPISGFLIDNFNFRVAYRLLSLALAVITFITIIFFITDDPKKKGKLAYGAEEAAKDAAKPGGQSQLGGVTPGEARSTASFWLLLFGILLIGCSTNIENYLPAFWRSQGISGPAAASVMGIYAFIAGICTIILGRITDKMGGKAYITFTAVMFIIGTILIYFVGAAASVVLILVVIPFAAGAKKTSTLTPPLVVAESFGRLHYGAIIGYYAGVLQLGIAISNPIIGNLHRISGGYKVPFFAMVALNAVGFVLVVLALTTAPYKKKLAEQKAAAAAA